MLLLQQKYIINLGVISLIFDYFLFLINVLSFLVVSSEKSGLKYAKYMIK